MLCVFVFVVLFFFKQKTAYEMRISDWSSDVCSSDLLTLSSSSGLALKAMVMAGQLASGIGPWSRVTVPAALSIAVTVPLPFAILAALSAGMAIFPVSPDISPLLDAASVAEFAAVVSLDSVFWPQARSEEHTSELQSLMRISY